MKATKATIQARIEDILQIRLDGAEAWNIRQYVAEKHAAGEEPWKLAEGEAPLSERQLRRYVARADQLIAESCRTSRKKLLRRHLAQRRSLYARAVATGDLRTALAVLRDEAELRALYGGIEQAEPDGDAPPPAAIEGTSDVVRLLAERLRQLDAAELPIGEKARLTAALSDSLLRALAGDAVEKRLKAVEEALARSTLRKE